MERLPWREDGSVSLLNLLLETFPLDSLESSLLDPLLVWVSPSLTRFAGWRMTKYQATRYMTRGFTFSRRWRFVVLVFWTVTQYSNAVGYKSFGGTFCPCLQGEGSELHPEGEGSMVLRKPAILHRYTPSRHREYHDMNHYMTTN
jgi:hypothetical protein